MNKNILATVVIAGSIFATPLFASNIFHKFMLDKQSAHPAANVHAQSPVKHGGEKYTDFSGDWAGSCVSGDMEMSMDVTIENDESHFSWDGDELHIGPLHTTTDSDNSTSSFDHTSLEWSTDMSMLIMKNVSFAKSHSEFPYNEPTSMETFISQMVLSLNNEQLIIKGQTVFFLDVGKQGGENTMTCTFNKK